MKAAESNHYAKMRAHTLMQSTYRELEPLEMALQLARLSIAYSRADKNKAGEKIFVKTELEILTKISNQLS